MSVPPPCDVTILLLAAGSSSRMRGADKLTQLVDGTPLLRRQARAAVATGAPVIVALPPRHHARLACLHDLPLAVIEVPGAAEGMGESLRLGALAAGRPDGLMVMLADMPDIETADLTLLIEGFTKGHASSIVRAGAKDGTPGHPVILPADCLPDLADLRGDTGARAILAANRGRCVTLPLAGRRALVDLDTPEAWAAWRSARDSHT
ncbi:nucleotidyltransferase family protein [Oceaniglobus trochenteri]|uniref:nucleotidyltransferase family protein n=1 Tax=Oceaniglobus trochenteri TaxID=2763260 RepID=UPI001CFF7CB6|nr:nucleotidyltransferase family protein [Oceaniglobus trochenteri]